MTTNTEHFDVVIVGARCAGSPMAAMLARRGLRVCLVDKSRFPSETLSTHVIHPCGVAILERLGMLDAILDAGAVSLTRFTLTDGDAQIDAAIDAEAFGAPSLCIRRVSLDHLLVDAAASAGAEVRTGTRVTTLLQADGRVAGVETEQGRLRAPLVIGADGQRSTVAGLVGAAEYHVAPPTRLFTWAYFEGVAETEARLRLRSSPGHPDPVEHQHRGSGESSDRRKIVGGVDCVGSHQPGCLYERSSMKPEKSEPCRTNPSDEIRLGRSSWNDDDVSIKYTWFDKNGHATRGGEVPIAALPQMLEFAIRERYLTIGAD